MQEVAFKNTKYFIFWKWRLCKGNPKIAPGIKPILFTQVHYHLHRRSYHYKSQLCNLVFFYRISTVIAYNVANCFSISHKYFYICTTFRTFNFFNWNHISGFRTSWKKSHFFTFFLYTFYYFLNLIFLLFFLSHLLLSGWNHKEKQRWYCTFSTATFATYCNLHSFNPPTYYVPYFSF